MIIDRVLELESVSERLKKEKRPIFLYGMGDGAEKIYSYLSAHGVTIQGIVASDGFLRGQSFLGFDIYYRVDCFDDKSKMYSSNFESVDNLLLQTKNSMFVNELVLINTDAGEKVEKKPYSEYTEYNYVFTNLSKNLKKEADGK